MWRYSSRMGRNQSTWQRDEQIFVVASRMDHPIVGRLAGVRLRHRYLMATMQRRENLSIPTIRNWEAKHGLRGEKNVRVCMQSHTVKASHASELKPLHHGMWHIDPVLEDLPTKPSNVPIIVINFTKECFPGNTDLPWERTLPLLALHILHQVLQISLYR